MNSDGDVHEDDEPINGDVSEGSSDDLRSVGVHTGALLNVRIESNRYESPNIAVDEIALTVTP